MLLCSPATCASSTVGERRGDDRAPVAALRAVALVAETRHQLLPRVGDAQDVPAGLRRRARPAVAGDRRADDVERVASDRRRARAGCTSGSMMSRNSDTEPGQPCVMTSGNASGSGERAWMKWTCCAVDVGEEVRPPVEPRFLRAPVERRSPRLAELLEVREVGAVVPARARESGRANACDASRSRRSSSTASGTSTRNGRMSSDMRPNLSGYTARSRLRARPSIRDARLVRREPHDRGDDRHDAAHNDRRRSAGRSRASCSCRRARTLNPGSGSRRSPSRCRAPTARPKSRTLSRRTSNSGPPILTRSSLPEWPIDPLAPFRLDGRVAIVTGASAGLGARFARVLGRGRRPRRGRRAPRRTSARRSPRSCRDAHVVPCDLVGAGAPAALGRAPRSTHFGRVDVLVNNAGTSDPTPALDESTEHFSSTLQINLVAPFELARECARVDDRRRADRARSSTSRRSGVSSASGRSRRPATPRRRAALVNLTRELAAQWARRGVRVNCLAPGLVSHGDDRRPHVRRRERGTMDAPTHADGPRRRGARARRRVALPRERREQLRHRPGASASTAAGPRSDGSAPVHVTPELRMRSQVEVLGPMPRPVSTVQSERGAVAPPRWLSVRRSTATPGPGGPCSSCSSSRRASQPSSRSSPHNISSRAAGRTSTRSPTTRRHARWPTDISRCRRPRTIRSSARSSRVSVTIASSSSTSRSGPR